MTLIIFDFETGGTRPEHPNIQLAAIALDEEWKEVGSFERKLRFNPEFCEAEALRMNHYEAGAWESAVDPDLAFVDFCSWLEPHKSVEMTSRRTGRPYKVARIAAYNAAFDKDRLWAMADSRFVPCHPHPMCIMQLAAWATLAGKIKPSSMKLSEVAKALQVEAGGAHDALADVRIAGSVAAEIMLRFF